LACRCRTTRSSSAGCLRTWTPLRWGRPAVQPLSARSLAAVALGSTARASAAWRVCRAQRAALVPCGSLQLGDFFMSRFGDEANEDVGARPCARLPCTCMMQVCSVPYSSVAGHCYPTARVVIERRVLAGQPTAGRV
jgi:hypothetical protein